MCRVLYIYIAISRLLVYRWCPFCLLSWAGWPGAGRQLQQQPGHPPRSPYRRMDNSRQLSAAGGRRRQGGSDSQAGNKALLLGTVPVFVLIFFRSVLKK